MIVRALQLGALFVGWFLWLVQDGTDLEGTVIFSGMLSFIVLMVFEWLRLNRAIETLTGVLKRAAEPVPMRPERFTRGLGFFFLMAGAALIVTCAGLIRDPEAFLFDGLEQASPEEAVLVFTLAMGLAILLLAFYTALFLRLLLGSWTLRRFSRATRHLAAVARPDFPTPIPGWVALSASPFALMFWLDWEEPVTPLDPGSAELVFELGPDDSLTELDDRLLALKPERVHDDYVPHDRTGLNRQFVLSVSYADRARAQELLEDDWENVDWVEPVSMAQVPEAEAASRCASPVPGRRLTNDPYSQHQYGLERTELLELAKLRPLVRRPETLVAVVDLGIDASHPDLKGVVRGGYGRGSVHGTGVAGVLAAKSHNYIGVSSPNHSGQRIELLDFALSERRTPSWEVADAITDAVDEGAQVINLSLAGVGTTPQVVVEALEYAEQEGVLVVAAAGNKSGARHWPARHGTVLSVASTNRLGNSSGFNGAGPDLKAPGEAICTTQVGGGYGSLSGTSLAAPYVSGIAASLLYLCPKANPKELRNALQVSSEGGEVRAYQAYVWLALTGQCVAT
ncbi:MAG: S8 family serine peptidase [Myxococcota bacterium]|nr:S8 family serine peptidase [Myxococcota bacterium]